MSGIIRPGLGIPHQPGILVPRLPGDEFAANMDSGEVVLAQKAEPVIEALIVRPGIAQEIANVPFADMPGAVAFLPQTLRQGDDLGRNAAPVGKEAQPLGI